MFDFLTVVLTIPLWIFLIISTFAFIGLIITTVIIALLSIALIDFIISIFKKGV